jgi:hypothetical protein
MYSHQAPVLDLCWSKVSQRDDTTVVRERKRLTIAERPTPLLVRLRQRGPDVRYLHWPKSASRGTRCSYQVYRVYRHAEWKWTEWGLGFRRMGQEAKGGLGLIPLVIEKGLLMGSTGTVGGLILSCRLIFQRGHMRWIRRTSCW